MRIICCLLVMAAVFMYPQTTSNAAREALSIYAHDIIPSLYPYMVLTRFIAEKLKKVRHPPLWFAVILGLLGGTPSGYSILAALLDQHIIRRRTLYSICTLMGTISPVFLLNTGNLWFSDRNLIALLLIAHFAGAAISSAIVAFFMRKDASLISPKIRVKEADDASPIFTCVYSVLGIGGCLVFFSVLSALMESLLSADNPTLTSVFHAVLEIAGGLRSLSNCPSLSRDLKGILCAVCCGFSGISMLSQSHLFVKQFGINMNQLILWGGLRAVMSGAVMSLLILPT